MNIFKKIFKKKEKVQDTDVKATDTKVGTTVVNSIEKNYSVWEQDLGFINMVAKQHLRMAISFDIAKLKTSLLDVGLRIKDEDLEKIYSKVISNVLGIMSDEYLNMLYKYYFGNKESLEFYLYNFIYLDIFNVATDINIQNSVKSPETDIKH